MRRPLRHEDAVLFFALSAAAIPSVIALPLIWFGGYSLKTQITLTLVIVLGSVGLAVAARTRVLRPLQTLANLSQTVRASAS